MVRLGSTPEIQTIRAADLHHQAEFGHNRSLALLEWLPESSRSRLTVGYGALTKSL
jgi:hypothetical protein